MPDVEGCAWLHAVVGILQGVREKCHEVLVCHVVIGDFHLSLCLVVHVVWWVSYQQVCLFSVHESIEEFLLRAVATNEAVHAELVDVACPAGSLLWRVASHIVSIVLRFLFLLWVGNVWDVDGSCIYLLWLPIVDEVVEVRLSKAGVILQDDASHLIHREVMGEDLADGCLVFQLAQGFVSHVTANDDESSLILGVINDKLSKFQHLGVVLDALHQLLEFRVSYESWVLRQPFHLSLVRVELGDVHVPSLNICCCRVHAFCLSLV